MTASKYNKLSDIADMDDYLENRCYCPYEIYDMSGLWYKDSVSEVLAIERMKYD